MKIHQCTSNRRDTCRARNKPIQYTCIRFLLKIYFFMEADQCDQFKVQNPKKQIRDTDVFVYIKLLVDERITILIMTVPKM